MTDIQQARDVLAKWRHSARSGPWQRYDAVNDWSGEPREVVKAGPTLIGPDMLLGNAPLIVGTAGNPELWEALDGLLRHHAEDGITVSAIATWVRLVADAIIAADERMSA